MSNSEHQNTTPFDDRDRLPEELRRVAQRYAALPVPRPTSEETGELIARLQASSSAEPSYLPAHSGEVARDAGAAHPEGPELSHFRIRYQRRGRRVMHFLEALAAVLVVGIVVGSFLLVLAQRQHHAPTPSASVTSQPTPTRQTPAGTVSSLQTIHMIDATTGWALTSTSLLRTTNGWRTWRDVTPHKAAIVGAGYFLSSQEAWVSEASGLGLQAGQKPAVIVSHTTNGGQTWQSATLSVTVPNGVFSMSFSNEQDGWAEAELGGATGNDLVELFRTTDGGKSWVAVSSNGFVSQDHIPNTFPYGGHATGITFINASTGWVVNTGKLYITHDGGTTWRQQTFPTAPGQGFALPIFFTARDGFLATSTQLFVTQDGGTTWKPGPLLPQSSGLVTFIDMQHGWLTVDSGTALYRTSDGGEHWAKITPAFTARITGFAQLNFVSTEIGWALGYQAETANTLLFKTTDGGKSWTQVILAIP